MGDEAMGIGPTGEGIGMDSGSWIQLLNSGLASSAEENKPEGDSIVEDSS